MQRTFKVVAIQNIDYTNRNKQRIVGQRLAVRELNDSKVMDECYLSLVWVTNGAYAVGDKIIVKHGKFGNYVPKRYLELEGI